MKKRIKTRRAAKRGGIANCMKLKSGISTALVAVMALFVLPVSAFAGYYDLTVGSVSITATDLGQFVTQDNGVANQADNAPVIGQSNPATATSNTVNITADAGKTASVTIDGVNIDTSAADTAAIGTSGAGNVTIELDGTNSVTSADVHAGVEKNNTGNLTIADVDGDGSLTAQGGMQAAGIGGIRYTTGSDITISGGTIIATGGESAAGIGSGMVGAGNNKGFSNITVSGGNVTANGGSGAAGIVGGRGGYGSDITISGGTVNANGSGGGAGIGGGTGAYGSDITVSGGTVTAESDDQGAGIGGGFGCSGSDITISGGTVTATGGESGAGIGGGYNGSGSDITISGGTVTATGGESGAGIGGGTFGSASGISVSGSAQVKVQGGTVSTYYGEGTGIGSGGSRDSSRVPVNGAETTPDTSRLQTNGRIDYYAPGADINSADPTTTIVGTVPPPTAANHSCNYFTVTIGKGERQTTVKLCPLCGAWGGKRAQTIANARISAVDDNALPDGTAVFFGMDAPFDGALYAFTAVYQDGGQVNHIQGKVSVELPLDAEKYGDFKLVRVDVTEATETAERQETWTELEYTLENGKLSFETDKDGVFLLLPR